MCVGPEVAAIIASGANLGSSIIQSRKGRPVGDTSTGARANPLDILASLESISPLTPGINPAADDYRKLLPHVSGLVPNMAGLPVPLYDLFRRAFK